MNDKVEGQGRTVILPDGTKRIDYIRDAYYDKKTGTHTEACTSRSDIKKAINEMLPEGKGIEYQIVFAATKTAEDPRVAQAKRAVEAAERKAEKEKAAADEKAAKEKAAKEEKVAAEKKAAATKK